MSRIVPVVPKERTEQPQQVFRMVNGQKVLMMLVRMRCEACHADHRMLIEEDMPLGRLPELTKETFRCKCKHRIPTITKMDKSLMSINAVPFSQLQNIGLFAGAKASA